jgi:hypothetical protein
VISVVATNLDQLLTPPASSSNALYRARESRDAVLTSSSPQDNERTFTANGQSGASYALECSLTGAADGPWTWLDFVASLALS